jgi:CheY-like chemotaxis protein
LILKKLKDTGEADPSAKESLPTNLSASGNWLLNSFTSDRQLPENQTVEWHQFLENATEIWKRFFRFLVPDDETPGDDDSLIPAPAETLREELVRNVRDLPEEVGGWTPRDIGIIESLLAGLTECRTKAGIRTPITSRKAFSKNHPGSFAPSLLAEPIGDDDSPSTTLRVLVVDDHAVPWKPVLRAVHGQLERRLKARIRMEFSTDGEHVKTNSNWVPLLGSIAEYDVILLDIFMGEVFGLNLLRKIRAAFLHLPIVLWTTSRDIDLPSEANLANGFLFKKTTTIDAIVETLIRWLEHGRASRVATLPNRFFDHTIRRFEWREAISHIMRWALQLVDGFPALSNSYFRGFTDHGGRHFVQLLQYSEQLIRPLLLAGQLFSSDLEEREEELTAFYLAVICHEFGMFPVFAPLERKIKHLNAEESDLVRRLHAVRGMEFLGSAERWPRDFREAASTLLDSSDFLGTAVPLLVGYHSRLLSLKTFGRFKENAESTRRLRKLEETGSGTRRLHAPSLRSVSESLSLLTSRDVFFRRGEVIRGLCGLFRFVDAIDVDRSRVPPAFLRTSKPVLRRGGDQVWWARKYKQYAVDLGEYIKQELVDAVNIDRGRVTFHLIVPKPTESSLAAARHLLSEIDFEAIERPWSSAGRSVIGNRELRKRLDAFLVGEISRLKDTRQSVPGLARPLQMQARVLATVAALAVGGQVLEEYEGIQVCGLSEQIELGDFAWGTDDDWLSDAPVLRSLYRMRGLSSTSRS